jgi:hypothetical protein
LKACGLRGQGWSIDMYCATLRVAPPVLAKPFDKLRINSRSAITTV